MDIKKTVIGIDLGTSNISLTHGDLDSPELKAFPISQVEGPGKIKTSELLPASLLLPSTDSEKEDNKKLPWNANSKEEFSHYTLGSYAQDRGIETPSQVINSAKSWLCHKHIDPKSPQLPWGSNSSVKLSAFDSTKAFLEHLKSVFNWEQEKSGSKMQLCDFDTVITVPASFDEDARRLVYESAQSVGFKKASLLEEPQAALYSWIGDHEETWRETISPGDLVLVCDIGGGTSDFSLVCVGEEEGKLKLERISVGRHLLLGGDNMDHALAYHLKRNFEAKGKKLDRWQYMSLVNQVKQAKEKFFSDETLEKTSLAVASKGSSLFAKTQSLDLTKKDVEEVLTSGFFPLCEKGELPQHASGMALQDLGLEYEADPAITKHLAEFLAKSAKNLHSSKKLQNTLTEYGFDLEAHLEEGFLKPTCVLFNGGVFGASPLRKRVLDALIKWGSKNVKELPGFDLSLAVSRGAAYYAKIKKSGKGIRIASGTARSYYLGIESSGMAIPGVPPSIKGLCLVPQGTKEGTELPSPEKEFGLMTGREVQFRFFSSDERAGDLVGSEVFEADEHLNELPAMKVKLKADKNDQSKLVPVSIGSFVNDVGILELSMKNKLSDKKWDLEFNVRKQEE